METSASFEARSAPSFYPADPDTEPIEARADTSHGAALAVIARRLGCEVDLVDALGRGSRRT